MSGVQRSFAIERESEPTSASARANASTAYGGSATIPPTRISRHGERDSGWAVCPFGYRASGRTLDIDETADIKNRKYYVKTYKDQVLRGVDLMSFDLDAKDFVKAPLTPQMEAPALDFPATQ